MKGIEALIPINEKCMSQKNVDLIIDGTATLPVAKRLIKSGYIELNNSNFKEIFFWITNYKNFSKFIITKYRLPKILFFPSCFILQCLNFFKFKQYKDNKNYKTEISQNVPLNIYDLYRNNKSFSLKKDKHNICRRIQNGLNKKDAVFYC